MTCETGCFYRRIFTRISYSGRFCHNFTDTGRVCGTGNRKKIHRMARKYIDNVCLHMYSMRTLPLEIRQRFKSDMRVVVDYLAEGEQYTPTDQEIKDIDATMGMLHALTGETILLDNKKLLQEEQERGGKVTMGYAATMYVERGRQEGRQRGMREEKIRGATAFVKESILQKQSKEYIKGMLQTCFQLKEEEADTLYREGYEREHEAEIPALT